MSDTKTIEEKTIEGGKSYAVISILSQVFSWVFTFLVIRILNPEDYGLMAMAAFITSFIHVFSGLGLGAGIVQRKEVTEDDYNSVFWFSILVGFIMCIVAFFLAYPNAYIFDNDDLIPITQLSALLFLVSAVATVPQNILSRNFEFKKIAIVNMVSALISSVCSVAMAYNGFGVYTLILSTLLLQALRSTGMMLSASWFPSLHFNFTEVKPFIKFGVVLSLASGFSQFLDAVDKLIIGKLYNAVQLGYYDTAISVSAMPIDKISPLINPVVFPLFSRWQDDNEKVIKAYLNILTYYLLIIAPMYIGGLIVAENLIGFVLGEKWLPIVFIFQFFCWVQLSKVFSSYHKILLTSQGSAKNILKYDIVLALILVSGIYIAAINGFDYVIYTWAVIYPSITFIWIFLSFRNYGISIFSYLRTILKGIMSSLLMGVALLSFNYFILSDLEYSNLDFTPLLFQLMVGAVAYVISLYLFQKQLVLNAINTLFKR